MHILLASDSYKDALPARDAVTAMAAGIQRASPKVQWDECPMGDGGEGTLDALIVSTGAQRRHQMVQDALGRACQAEWGWHAATRIAYIELAEACGLQAPRERTTLQFTDTGHSSTSSTFMS
jgi:glycerate 2-kinase